MAVLAPIPSARVIMATVVNPGLFTSIRAPYCKSFHIFSIKASGCFILVSGLWFLVLICVNLRHLRISCNSSADYTDDTDEKNQKLKTRNLFIRISARSLDLLVLHAVQVNKLQRSTQSPGAAK